MAAQRATALAGAARHDGRPQAIDQEGMISGARCRAGVPVRAISASPRATGMSTPLAGRAGGDQVGRRPQSRYTAGSRRGCRAPAQPGA